MVEYYWTSLLLFGLYATLYTIVRGGIVEWLRNRRISKTRIRKLTKGIRNYWWYERLHRECGLGILYAANKAFTLLYLSAMAAVLTSVFLRIMIVVAAFLFVAASVLLAGMLLYSSMQYNEHRYGRRFIWLCRRENRGFDSSIIDVFSALFVVVMAVVYGIMACATFCLQK